MADGRYYMLVDDYYEYLAFSGGKSSAAARSLQIMRLLPSCERSAQTCPTFHC